MQYCRYLIFLIFLGSCKDGGDAGTVASEAKSQSATPSPHYYKRFEGTIANQPVVLQLHKMNEGIEAQYYYKNSGAWLMLQLDSTAADSLYFSEHQPVDNWREEEMRYAQLRCKLEGSKLSGYWLSADTKKSFPFQLEEKYPNGSYAFEANWMEAETVAFPKKTGSPKAVTDAFFISSPESDWLNNQLKQILHQDTTLSFERGFEKSVKAYADNYRKMLAEEVDTSMPMETLNYAQSQRVWVRYNDHDLLTLESLNYEYSGGAHGNYGSSFYCFDLLNKKRITLSDVIDIDSASLQQIVEQHFRTQYHIKASSLSEVLFDEHLSLTDNFYIAENGLGFLYNPYEVASYAQGQINVFIPFAAVKKYLSPSLCERLKIK